MKRRPTIGEVIEVFNRANEELLRADGELKKQLELNMAKFEIQMTHFYGTTFRDLEIVYKPHEEVALEVQVNPKTFPKAYKLKRPGLVTRILNGLLG